PQLREAVSWMREQVHAGRRVYVHCRAGIGRSATVVAAFLMEEYGLTADEAWRRVRSRRPIVLQTDDQRRSLDRFAGIERSGGIERSAGAGPLERGFERGATERLGEIVGERVDVRERVEER